MAKQKGRSKDYLDIRKAAPRGKMQGAALSRTRASVVWLFFFGMISYGLAVSLSAEWRGEYLFPSPLLRELSTPLLPQSLPVLFQV